MTEKESMSETIREEIASRRWSAAELKLAQKAMDAIQDYSEGLIGEREAREKVEAFFSFMKGENND